MWFSQINGAEEMLWIIIIKPVYSVNSVVAEAINYMHDLNLSAKTGVFCKVYYIVYSSWHEAY